MFIRNLAALTVAAMATGASAADFSFTGNFDADNSRAAYSFSIAAPTVVTLRTLGYAGGTNAAGASIAQGGFDPVLTLYNNNTKFAIGDNDDDASLPVDSVTGVSGDAQISGLLAAGTYRIFLSQYDNFGPAFLGVSNFPFANQPNFRGGFIDFYGDQRNGGWALDILGADSAAVAGVPEPASWAMLIAGFGLVGVAARRRSRAVAA